MSSLLRLLVLLCAVVGVVVAVPTVRLPVAHTIQGALDKFDKRAPKTVLILGNSRIFVNDMPSMVRDMADSARSPVLYSITARTWGGARFEDLWQDSGVQRLLHQRWDYVILQSESGAQADDGTNESFLTYGENLISTASASGSPVAVIVNWAYDDSFYVGPYKANRPRHIASIEASSRVLARRTGASLIDTGAVWEEVRAADARLPLYWPDGNHPTINGSYLSALMVYGFISRSSVSNVTFRPSGLDEEAAQTLKHLVAQYYVYEPG